MKTPLDQLGDALGEAITLARGSATITAMLRQLQVITESLGELADLGIDLTPEISAALTHTQELSRSLQAAHTFLSAHHDQTVADAKRAFGTNPNPGGAK